MRDFIGAEFLGNIIGVHPNENTGTVWLNAVALIRIIKAHGNDDDIVDLNGRIFCDVSRSHS
jgi:Ala-tRNA(Pro) deacylase